jgi:hypothetical protein
MDVGYGLKSFPIDVGRHIKKEAGKEQVLARPPLSGDTMPAPANPTKRSTDFSPTRELTEPEIRQIISQRKSGQDIVHIAAGMNLPSNLVRRITKGEAFQMISAPIFAKMVFPGSD